MAQKKKKIPKQSFEDWSRQQHGVPDDEQSVARRKAWDNVYNAYYAGDDADIARSLCCRVNVCEVLRYLGVGVE